MPLKFRKAKCRPLTTVSPQSFSQSPRGSVSSRSSSSNRKQVASNRAPGPHVTSSRRAASPGKFLERATASVGDEAAGAGGKQ